MANSNVAPQNQSNPYAASEDTTPLPNDVQLQYALLSGNPTLIAQKEQIAKTGSAITPQGAQAAAQADLASSDPQIRAQGEYLQTGQAPSGYSVNAYGTLQKNPSLMDAISNTVGKWGPLAVAGATAGFALPAILGSGAGVGTDAAVPDLGVSSGLPAGVGTDVTTAGTYIPGTVPSGLGGVLDSSTALGSDVSGAGVLTPGQSLLPSTNLSSVVPQIQPPPVVNNFSGIVAPGAGSSVVSKILNPKNVTQNAIKGLTGAASSNGQQQQYPNYNSSQSATATTGTQAPPQLPTPPTTQMPGFGNVNAYSQVQPDVSAAGPTATGELPLSSIIQQLISGNQSNG